MTSLRWNAVSYKNVNVKSKWNESRNESESRNENESESRNENESRNESESRTAVETDIFYWLLMDITCLNLQQYQQ